MLHNEISGHGMHAEQEKYERLPFKTVSAQSKTIGQFKVFILYSSM